MSILADIGITKKHVLITVVVLCIVAALTLGSSLLEEVESGTYQVKQAAMTGNMTAHLTPGLYWQVFGRISVWPKAKTFYFTADTEEGESRDQSIEVRFNDGATASISGSTRIVMPISEVQAIDIITKHGYRIYSDLAARLVLPAIRSSLRMSANLMSSRESYSEKRNDFRAWAWDQVLNGVYQTEEETRRVKDPITGKEETKVYKKIKIGKDGEPLRQPSPLEGMGITLQNFEIKRFVYTEKVKVQIESQQDAIMAVATARANALKAEAEEKKEEAEGRRRVTKAKYEEEEKKAKAIVKAEQEKEVAELDAQRELEVAKLQKQSALEQKEREILLGEGEAKRKALVLAADGALKDKLAAMVQIHGAWAEAYKTRKVPQIMMGGANVGTGSAGLDGDARTFMRLMTMNAAKQIGLDMTIPQGRVVISSSEK